MKHELVKRYLPDASIKAGFFTMWQDMTWELINSRELIWRLFLRDFLAKYKQSVLGVLWALIIPVVAVGTFVFLNMTGVLNIGNTGVPYPVFAFLGLTIWQLFASGLTACSNSIVQGGTMVAKINFPKESLVIASLAQSVFDFLIRLGLLAVVFVIYGVIPAWTSLFFPIALIPLVLLTLGLGFILSLLNVIMRDIGNIVALLTTFLLFLTPVLYPTPQNETFIAINALNPLTPLIAVPRDLVILGSVTGISEFLLASIFSIIIFSLSWSIFHLAEARMAERV